MGFTENIQSNLSALSYLIGEDVLMWNEAQISRVNRRI